MAEFWAIFNSYESWVDKGSYIYSLITAVRGEA
jgi:hypothetical protein